MSTKSEDAPPAEETPATVAEEASPAANQDVKASDTTKADGDAAAATDPAVKSEDSAGNQKTASGLDPRWDHTSRKVVVHGVLKFLRAKEIPKLVSSWIAGRENDFVIEKTKKPPKDSWLKITLKEEGMVDDFIELINKGGENGGAMKNVKGRPLFAKRADEEFQNQRDGDRKRKERDGDDNNDSNNKRGRQERARSERPITILSNDEVRDRITPLWRKTYEEQLDQKAREMVNKCALKIVKEIKGKFR